MTSYPNPRKALTAAIIRPSREESEKREDSLLWLDKNENMDPLFNTLKQKLLADLPAKAFFAYPDCFVLYKKLSQYLQMPINQLLIAAGSDGIIRALYEAFLSPGDAVMYTEPTFAMYSLYAQIVDAQSILLPYQPSDLGPVLCCDTVINAIKSTKPKLICLPNPNSPSGTVFKPDELHRLVTVAGSTGSIMLIDEAYYPFYPETALAWINDYPHLMIARTFSKAWGLAGIRLGFGIGSKHLMNALHKARPMYEAGALSITIAERILDYSAAMLASVQRLNAGKKFFLTQMQTLGLRTLHSEGNFLHVAFDHYAETIHDRLKDKVLYRKDFGHPSLAGYSRFTSTTQELFLPVVKVIRDVVNGS